MNDDPVQEAILAALSQDWKRALEINLQILDKHPEDIDTMNRTAKAFFELGNFKKAVSFAKKVLEIDPLNTIASKNLSRYLAFSKNQFEGQEVRQQRRNIKEFFIEEPGKTKTVALINLGEQNVIVGLSCGEVLDLLPGQHRISVSSCRGKKIGRLPDDLASRMLNLLNQGYEYEIFVRSTANDNVKVFIRESKRIQPDNPSFPFRNA